GVQAESFESKCAKVISVTGIHCPNLNVKLDLDKCDDSKQQGDSLFLCKNDVVTEMSFQTKSMQYKLMLTKNLDDQWIAGTLYEESKTPASKKESDATSTPFVLKGAFAVKTLANNKTDFKSQKSYSFLRLR